MFGIPINYSPLPKAQAVPAVSRQSPAAFFQAAKVDITAWLQGDIGACPDRLSGRQIMIFHQPGKLCDNYNYKSVL